MSTRAECEKIGLRCVEELLEKGIAEDQLLKAVSRYSEFPDLDPEEAT